MKFYLEEKDAVLKELSTSNQGLSEQQSRQRLEQYGSNKLKEGKKTPLIVRFLSQMADPMIIILLVAAAISAVTSVASGENAWADVGIILFVVVVNAVLGVVQESKAEKAIEALKEMSAATSKVMRDSKVTVVRSEELVPGDIIILEAGDAVPADARILESASMTAEESALTGESVPVSKTDSTILMGEKNDVPLGDRKNMVYAGSTIVYGRGTAVVTATGMSTEMGKIADAITNAKDGLTPLQQKLGQLSKVLTWLVLGICVLIFAFSFFRNGDYSLDGVLSTFMLAVSLAVAAIPEGLVAVVTIVLSMGVTKMSKQNAIIRKMTAVETLGCTGIICSDKTGTLTQNKMTVTEHYGDEQMLAKVMGLCNDATYMGNGESQGEPTECALVNYAVTVGVDQSEYNVKTPRVAEVPFDSGRKMMTTIHHAEDNDKYYQYTKGAPDVVLKRCTSYFENNKVYPMTDEKREEILSKNKAFADKALRVLSAAVRFYDEMPAEITSEALEKELVFVGLTGMIDPVRPEVVEAIKECRSAGIRPVMITGDHLDTAVAIAKELGVVEDKNGAITGADLDLLSDEELADAITKFSVYARVQPEHKVRIVKAWQSHGAITAMTGDGVNDAPSIKNADIGIGMGITGTDVTKNVADMVLADDNFATIVSAVKEGRRIYDNIRKAIQFLLASNMSEVLSIFTATMIGFTILKPTHLLWINLITDSFPALALGVEESEQDVMKRKPRSTKDGIFSNGVGFDIAYQGVLTTILVFAAYFIGHYFEAETFAGFHNSADGMTMAFLTMSMVEIFHSLNMRSQRKSLFSLKKMNWTLIGAMALSFVLTTCVIYVPVLRDIFGFTKVSVHEFGIAVGLAFLIIPLVELVKLVQRIIASKKA